MKNELNKLNSAYNKKFKKLYKDFFIHKDIGLIAFVEYLKYLRDFYTISSLNEHSKVAETNLATLNAAVAEFDTYNKSQDIIQKAFHWDSFCTFIKLNMEEWLEQNDSV